MTPGEALTAWLKADTDIAPLMLGVSPVGVPNRAVPSGETKPWVCYRWISGMTPVTHDGRCSLNLGGRMEVTCWGASMLLADRLNYLIRGKLGDFRGTMGSGGVLMACVGLAGPRHLKDPETGMMGSQSDFLLNVDESTIS